MSFYDVLNYNHKCWGHILKIRCQQSSILSYHPGIFSLSCSVLVKKYVCTFSNFYLTLYIGRGELLFPKLENVRIHIFGFGSSEPLPLPRSSWSEFLNNCFLKYSKISFTRKIVEKVIDVVVIMKYT